ncbi:uncharacterized protein [Engystomops pustulosus]|uniref:uncharacterized protein n=1 Tax=Engystomops pustulosus TaxID=76066 RepID=UPI003AFB07C9
MSMNTTQPPLFLIQDYITTGNTFPWNVTSGELTIVLCCVYIGNTLLGLTVNILVIWGIWPEVSISLGLPIYAINLLCAALMQCVILPCGVVYLLHSSAVGPIGCHILGLIPKVTQRAATMFSMWIFVVRYVAVSQPLNYSTFCKGWVVGSVSFTLWLTASIISAVEQGLPRDNGDLCFPDFRFTTEWALLHFIVSFLFSHLSLIHLCIFAYLISRSVKHSKTVPIEQYQRIRRLLIFVIINFGILFCPMHFVLQYYNIKLVRGTSNFQIQENLKALYQILFAFNSFSIIIAPFFYIISTRRVSTRLKRLIQGR